MVTLRGNEEMFRRSTNQGHSAAWEGSWQEAVEHYSRALQEFPDNSPTLNSLALAHFELGNLEQALELYKRAARLSPEDPLPLEKTALIHKQTGRIQEAVQYSMRAAELYHNLRDADKAINNWTRVTRLDADNIDAHARLAQAYEKLGRTPQAVTEYISVAALQQHAGKMDEARKSGDYALKLNPKNAEAQQAVAMLQAFKMLPKPVRRSGMSGPLDPLEAVSKPAPKRATRLDFQQGPDPIDEATQKAVQALAAMLFDLTPGGPEPARKRTSLRSFARSISSGLLSRGFDEKAIIHHLGHAIQLHTQGKHQAAIDELKAAIQAGLDHPAAHYILASLLSDEGEGEAAQRSFQKAINHPDVALASRLKLGDYLRQQGRYAEAVVEYLQALKIADSAVVPGNKAEALRRQYEILIASAARNPDEKAVRLLCENIHHLLLRPNWRTGIHEARGQLPGSPNGVAPAPIADILTHADSPRLVDALASINQIYRQGYFRAAMEEAYAALEFSPSYLPLHVQMGELLLMNERPQEAIEKFSTVARVYSARGEGEQATKIYERILAISPLDVKARAQLIDHLSAAGQIKEAAGQCIELADVYYRLAQLEKARSTYEAALHLAQGTHVEAAWNVQILHQIADIDLQRLDWRKALRVYEQLRTLAPNDETARLNLVQLNLRLGQEANANTELDNYLSFINSRGRDQDTITFLSGVVVENPRFALANRRLAEALQQNGQREEAIRQWNKVGELLVDSGDREGAKATVRAILALNPPNAERYQNFLNRLTK